MTAEPHVTLDFETRSGAPLRKTGAFRYAEDQTTQIMMLCYAIGDGPVKTWYGPEIDDQAHYGDVLKSGPNKGKRRQLLEAINLYDGDGALDELFYAIKHGLTVEAHNAMFERAVWGHQMVNKHGFMAVPHRQWRCSAAKAASYALPRSLEGAGSVCGLKMQKDMEGSKLLQRLMKTRKPTKDNPRSYFGSEEEFQRLAQYCVRDVEAERELSKKLPDFSDQEQELWLVDQAMNERGVQLDLELAAHGLELTAKVKKVLKEEIIELSGMEKATRPHILQWMQDNLPEFNPQDTTGDTMDAILEALPKEDPRHRIVTIARQCNKTTPAKFGAILQRANLDGRGRDNLMFHAASTGRWGGRGIQMQNLTRGQVKDMDAEVEIMLQMDANLLMDWTDRPIDKISGVIRGALIPGPGKEFMVADYSAVEARGVMWLADDQEALEIFRRGEDIYNAMASDIYGRPVDRKKKEDAEAGQLGKQAILGLGYGMGPGTFVTTCHGYGIELPMALVEQIVPPEVYTELEELLIENAHIYLKGAVREGLEDGSIEMHELVLGKFIVDRYRAKYSKVKAIWKELEVTAIEAIRDFEKGRPLTWRACCNGKIHYKMIGGFLACRLPSGRFLWYQGAHLKQKEAPWSTPEKPAYQDEIRFYGVDSVTKQWTRQHTYGGKLCENVVQGLCRDLLAYAMILTEQHPVYTPVLTVHDELISEVDKGKGSVTEFEELICQRQAWAKDFPLKAEGERLLRYKK